MLTIPLQPKKPKGPLRVIIIGRISTEYQDKENIPASYRVAEEYLHQNYNGKMEVRHFGEQASGMLAERSTIVQAEELIFTGQWGKNGDRTPKTSQRVLSPFFPDLSRIYRNPRYQWAFVQNAVDQHTRVICIADNIDTADENWEVMMHAAGIRHGLFVPDTRRRVRRKKRGQDSCILGILGVLSPFFSRHGATDSLRLPQAVEGGSR